MAADVVFGEIIREYFETVAAEMNTVMDRTALSPIFNEAHDCSAGLFFYDGEQANLIARANAEPVHIYASLYSVEGILGYWRNDLHPGDVILVNDPYFFGTHPGDWTVMTPVFHDNKPVFFPAVRGHIIEYGPPIAGGLSPDIRDIWQEAIRFAPLKLYARGEPSRDVWNWLRSNNRQPRVTEGDVNAMIGACRIGQRRMIEIIEKYGFEQVREGVDYVLDYSEQRMRAALANWPDGTYFGRSIADTDLGGNHDLNIDCTLHVRGDEVVADFTGTAPQGAGQVNSTIGNTGSWVYTAFSGVFPDIPLNSGFFRPISFHAPEGTLVNALAPAPTAVNTIQIGSNIGDAVMKALEQIVPKRVGACTCDLVIGMHLGADERYPEKPFFIHVDYLLAAVMSSGAYGVDGWGAWSTPHCSHRMPTVELTEVQTPVLYLQAEYARDTAAPGRWRGTPAWHAKRRNPDNQVVIWTVVSQYAKNPLPGWAGARDGVGNYLVLDYGGAREKRVVDIEFQHVSFPGEVLFAQSGGGGGWGPPLERDPQAVLDDVLDDYVSVEAAQRDYGVVIDPKRLVVLNEETAALRESLRTDGRS
jgi:N-methylhydantoinase B